jgi:hypothetical protein
MGDGGTFGCSRSSSLLETVRGRPFASWLRVVPFRRRGRRNRDDGDCGGGRLACRNGRGCAGAFPDTWRRLSLRWQVRSTAPGRAKCPQRLIEVSSGLPSVRYAAAKPARSRPGVKLSGDWAGAVVLVEKSRSSVTPDKSPPWISTGASPQPDESCDDRCGPGGSGRSG